MRGALPESGTPKVPQNLPPLKNDEIVDVTKEANVVITPQGVQKDVKVDLTQKPNINTESKK